MESLKAFRKVNDISSKKKLKKWSQLALSTVVERVISFVLDKSVRHVAYIVCYGQNVDEL